MIIFTTKYLVKFLPFLMKNMLKVLFINVIFVRFKSVLHPIVYFLTDINLVARQY